MPSVPPSPLTPSAPDKPHIIENPEQGGIKTKEDGDAKGQGPTKDGRDKAVASVYSQYMKMAKQEDKDLVTRWSETLTMLLTFAGLLSAVITAFLLASQPGLQPQPNASTNKILLHIARQLDNTTDTSQLDEEPFSSVSTLRALSYWHASLGCSLVAAFGSLLSKQWVLHYQSWPPWANSIEKQCHLREIRAYGVSKWRMHAIIEALPVLLQLSVFLFYLGLIESVSLTPILSRITTTFTSIIAAFYVFTLVSGAVSISCPFKSPANEFLLKVVISLLASPIYLLNIAFSILLYILVSPILVLLVLLGTKPSGMGIKNQLRDLPAKLTRYWHDRHYEFEQKLAQNPEICAGILFWWIQESKSSGAETVVVLQAVADVLKAIPVAGAYRMASWRGMFGKWCSEVFGALERESLSSETCLIEADLICHLMYQSAEGAQLVQTGLAEQHNPPDIVRYIYTTIREGWSRPSDGTAVVQPLSLKDMPRNTIAVYLRLQLFEWRDVEANSGTLLQELPIVLKPEYFSDLKLYANAIIDAAALAAIVLLPPCTITIHLQGGGVHTQQLEPPIDSLPLERLFQALERISYYPIEKTPHQLISLVVAATTRVILFKNDDKELCKSRIWSDGKFAACMRRLILLGRSWWHEESGEDQSGPGASLVHAVQSLMILAVDRGIAGCPVLLSNLLPITQESLEEVFGMYAHPDASVSASSGSTEATKLLNFVLISRYATYSPPKSAFRGTVLHLDKPPKYTWSTTPTTTLKLEGRIQILRQLIHDLGSAPTPGGSALRRGSLTVVVMGRDIFLPPWLSTQYSSLTSDLEHLASEMTRSNRLVYELTEEMSSGFIRWDVLLRALRDLLQSLERGASEGTGT